MYRCGIRKRCVCANIGHTLDESSSSRTWLGVTRWRWAVGGCEIYVVWCCRPWRTELRSCWRAAFVRSSRGSFWTASDWESTRPWAMFSFAYFLCSIWSGWICCLFSCSCLFCGSFSWGIRCWLWVRLVRIFRLLYVSRCEWAWLVWLVKPFFRRFRWKEIWVQLHLPAKTIIERNWNGLWFIE